MALLLLNHKAAAVEKCRARNGGVSDASKTVGSILGMGFCRRYFGR
jgi:hypothetical protein